LTVKKIIGKCRCIGNCHGHTNAEVIQVFCNQCGKEVSLTWDEHLHVNKRWGYGTCYDLTDHEFDLCEECYTKLIQNFKIKVRPQEYNL